MRHGRPQGLRLVFKYGADLYPSTRELLSQHRNRDLLDSVFWPGKLAENPNSVTIVW